MNPHWIEMLGYIAGLFTTFSLVPQLMRIVRLKTARDISVAMFLIFTLGTLLWLIYGVLLHSWPVIIWNLVSFLLSACILGLKLRFDHNATHEIAHPLSNKEKQ